jgi:hypothetical protein
MAELKDAADVRQIGNKYRVMAIGCVDLRKRRDLVILAEHCDDLATEIERTSRSGLDLVN